MKKIARPIDEKAINTYIDAFPVTAILGPRQCGKTTLARDFRFNHYFDLENPRDEARLDNPQIALENLKGMIVIDEIQRIPELFSLLRYLVDNRPEQKYLILGSASRDLIRQGSESLAGRIGFYHLDGFSFHDIGRENINRLWIRGTMPDSYLAVNEIHSYLWRENYIATFLERDIPQLGINIPARTLRRFWAMLAHYHGQVFNYSELGRSFGISDMTVRKYVDILEGTFMVRCLLPWQENLKKRQVKSPKLYLRDSGLFHWLMNIENFEQLNVHPKIGASWEGFALECACRSIGKSSENFYYWKIHSGSELDLFWRHGGGRWGMEFKYADAPRKTRSMSIVMNDLALEHLWVIYPGKQRYRLSEDITVLPLSEVPANWKYPDPVRPMGEI
ncbi:MAG: ATP-binding protein [Deltaproteobacteria bacterium]|nr:ATP-binding protein [Deltaproteobacteria bacterium]